MQQAHPADDTQPAAAGGASTRRGQRLLSPGVVLENRYEIKRVAGRGGMSTVYAARDLRFSQVERICAIKEMFDLDPDTNIRSLRLVNFERESALLATISHPAVPKIYDYFTHNGLVYLVLEYVDGQDLERLLEARKAPFEEAQLCQITTEVCSVLATLHGRQPDPIIFRDLKPSNIMLRSTGQIALVDFGIARTIQGRQRGTMIGTEGYAPPEQYRGIADARGDIYALGATLHHLATNTDPRQETPFTFHDRPIRKFNPRISDPFAALIAKMVAYNPADRHESVAAILHDLHALDRHPSLLATPTLGAPPPSRETEREPQPPHVGAGNVVPLGRRPAAKKRAARGRRVETGMVGERVAWSAQTDDEVRGSAIFDGRWFAIGSYDGHLYSLTPHDGSVRWKFRTGRGVVTRPAALNGLLFFGSEDNAVYAIDAVSGEQRWTFRTTMPVRSSPAAHRGQVFVGSDDGIVYALNAVDGAVMWRHRTWGPVRSSPAVAGGVVYCGSDDGNVYAINEDTGKLRWRAACGGPVQSVPKPLDDIVLVTSRHGYLSALSTATGDRTWQCDAQSGLISSPCVTNDVVVFGTTDGALLGVNVMDGSLRWSARHANQITSTALAAGDHAYIGAIDGDCLCFNVASGELLWRHHVGGGIVSTPVFGVGLLVVGSLDGRVYALSVTDDELEHD